MYLVWEYFGYSHLNT